jgi:hypothetical protein
MKENREKLPVLEEALLEALKALDNQIAREMQRDANSRDQHGAQKWEPYQTRIERLCSFLLNALGEQTIGLDGVIVLAQTFSKTLSFVTADLGEDGLGAVRSQYVKTTFENLERDAESAKRSLSAEPLLS